MSCAVNSNFIVVDPRYFPVLTFFISCRLVREFFFNILKKMQKGNPNRTLRIPPHNTLRQEILLGLLLHYRLHRTHMGAELFTNRFNNGVANTFVNLNQVEIVNAIIRKIKAFANDIGIN